MERKARITPPILFPWGGISHGEIQPRGWSFRCSFQVKIQLQLLSENLRYGPFIYLRGVCFVLPNSLKRYFSRSFLTEYSPGLTAFLKLKWCRGRKGDHWRGISKHTISHHCVGLQIPTESMRNDVWQMWWPLPPFLPQQSLRLPKAVTVYCWHIIQFHWAMCLLDQCYSWIYNSESKIRNSPTQDRDFDVTRVEGWRLFRHTLKCRNYVSYLSLPKAFYDS